MLREMHVKGLTFDPLTNTPIVVLNEPATDRNLPIWVGVAEANAIALELEKITSPRPMTHDLLRSILQQVEAQVRRVVVSDLRNSTYYAEIELDHPSKGSIMVDSRPSDAIALALRTKAPIFVHEKVFLASKIEEHQEVWVETDELKHWLENITPDDF